MHCDKTLNHNFKQRLLIKLLPIAVVAIIQEIDSYMAISKLSQRPRDPCQSSSFGNPRRNSFLINLNSSSQDDVTNDRRDDENEDLTFWEDLRKAKQEKLGAPIPSEQARQTAQPAENEFLQAMKQVSQEFESAKAELGTDGAVDLFKQIWDDEEEGRKEDGYGNDSEFQ